MPQTETMQPDHNGNTAYISPSDTIMSPTTKKLSEMKGKRFASAKPQSLFAKAVGKQALKGQGQGEEKVDGESGREKREEEQHCRRQQQEENDNTG